MSSNWNIGGPHREFTTGSVPRFSPSELELPTARVVDDETSRRSLDRYQAIKAGAKLVDDYRDATKLVAQAQIRYAGEPIMSSLMVEALAVSVADARKRFASPFTRTVDLSLAGRLFQAMPYEEMGAMASIAAICEAVEMLKSQSLFNVAPVEVFLRSAITAYASPYDQNGSGSTTGGSDKAPKAPETAGAAGVNRFYGVTDMPASAAWTIGQMSLNCGPAIPMIRGIAVI